MAPTVNDMINNHTLARNIIHRYHTDDEILDHDQLDLLKRFCEDTSQKDALLADADMTDEPDTRPGFKAADTRGNLAGFCIATYGTDRPALLEEEVQMLKSWFTAAH